MRPMLRETWRPVIGYEDSYDVSNLGRVRSWLLSGRGRGRRATPKLRRPVRNQRGGYLMVMLSRRGRLKLAYVHQLVLSAFVGPRQEGTETRHLNGDVTDNRAVNLRWGTHRENWRDAVRHGTDTRGERNGGAKLTALQVRTIRSRLRAGVKGVVLASMYAVSQATISRVKYGVRYG